MKMTDEQSLRAPRDEDGNRWLTTIASLLVGGAFFTLWFWLLPQWLGFVVELAGGARWRWLAALPSVLGFAVALRCIWDFGWRGRGTPTPIAPPQRLVVVGFYHFVRNPMYVGFAAGWIGLWIVFGRANPVAIVSVAAVALAVHLFVVFYEEPVLRNKFGGLRRVLPQCASLVAMYASLGEAAIAGIGIKAIAVQKSACRTAWTKVLTRAAI